MSESVVETWFGVEILQLSDSFVCIYDNIWTVLLEDVQDDDGGENVNVEADE